MSKAGEPRKVVDWDALEPHYRAGIRSLKDIGAEFEVSDAAIIKKARKEGWTRNLKAKIQAKADAKVSAAMVSAEVSAQTKVTEAVTVEVEASVAARIRLAHRTDIGIARTLVMDLMGEVRGQTSAPDLFARIEEALAAVQSGDESAKPKLSEALQRATSLSSRVGNVKSLVEAITRLVGLEREAYGIDDKKRNADTAGDIFINI